MKGVVESTTTGPVEVPPKLTAFPNAYGSYIPCGHKLISQLKDYLNLAFITETSLMHQREALDNAAGTYRRILQCPQCLAKLEQRECEHVSHRP